MGYTLVASFDQSFYQNMSISLNNLQVNKIPYGRNCDRNSANLKMKYHLTLIHWAKKDDTSYLPRIEQLKFDPFEITVTGTDLLYAEERSILLHFSVILGEGFLNATYQIEQIMQTSISPFLHITIGVSKEHDYIRYIKNVIDDHFCYPFNLSVSELDLYHIWEPVILCRQIFAGI